MPRKKPEQVKGTFVLEKNLKQHLVLASVATGREQSEIVNGGLRLILKELGCVNLDEPPNLPNFNTQIFETIRG